MGSLIYGSPSIKIEFDDRVLAHLQIVFGAKLRRGEAFFFSWFDDLSVGDGRSACWIHPGIPIYFKYNGSRMPALNREWIEQMAIAASSNGGLVLTEEPGDGGPVRAADNSVKRASP